MAVAALFLVFGGNLTGWSLLIIVIVLAVYLGLLQLVAAWARRVATARRQLGSGVGGRTRPGRRDAQVRAQPSSSRAPTAGSAGCRHFRLFGTFVPICAAHDRSH